MASAASAIYFLNLRGDILLERRYKDDVDRDIAESFRDRILNARDRDATAVHGPIRTLGSVTFMYLRHADIYILLLTRSNGNAMLSFQFMTSLVSLFQSYFEGDLTESSIRSNFVLMYELLDEVMDYGLPQLTDPAILKTLILQKGYKSEFSSLLGTNVSAAEAQAKKAKEAAAAANATLSVTGAVGWRREGIKYKRNEIFLDILEQVNVLMSSNGTVLRNDVVGRLQMKCFLSDMPEVRLGLNDEMQDVTFHQCVNLGAYEAQKVVTFVPPDGEFELMRYRVNEGVTLPFKVFPVISEVGRTKLEANVSVKSTFSNKLMAGPVVVLVPVPDNTASAKLLVTAGRAKYDATKKALVWKMSKFMGGAEQTLRAEVTLVASTREKKPWGRPPIQMQFQVPMLGCSGLRVQYMRAVERKQGSAYQVDTWVRKLCKSGDFLIRI
ncbi:hypothetical protein PLESTB_000705800 [Pleodorina starrii]|uniref:MHD domain-containing protein n=1 Tax=Pleodorina starrii TaxID=330485 RepID=A0A9W6BIZ2_9CHLO|nr:hypothetical protein PLESTM_001082400 [Pleodorina starrii]GLC53081.1 hypothetical protein PLESTB_000705800 [Pleodorina starrii]GLC69238.1 hypothetical protein PLESTF_000805800 [Pleodorina starrii]